MNSSLLVANFRDVGVTLNRLANATLLKEGVLFRGGTIRDVDDLALIRSPRTIVNLRKGRDQVFEGVSGVHCAAPHSFEVYDVASGSNRKWILSVLAAVTCSSSTGPFLIHCAAGKDRTGIIIGAILSGIGIDAKLIHADYMLSVGELQPELFSKALESFSDASFYRKVQLDELRRLFLSSESSMG